MAQPVPPTSGIAAPAARRRELLGKEFAAKQRYANDLPPLPFDPKSLKYTAPAPASPYVRASSEKYAQYHFPLPDANLDLVLLGLFDAAEFDAAGLDALYPAAAASTSHTGASTIDPRDRELLVDVSDAIKLAAGNTGSVGTATTAASAAASAASAAASAAEAATRRLVIPTDTTSSSRAAPKAAAGSRGGVNWLTHGHMRTADTPAEERRAIAASFTAAHAHATQRGGLRHPKRNVAAARIMPLLPALAQLADPHVLLLLPPHRGPSDSSGNAKAARPFSAGSLLMDTQAPEGDARQFVVYDPATSANDAPIIVTDGTPLRHAQSYRFEVRMDPTTHTQRIMVAVPPPSGALSGTSSAPALLMPVSTQFSLSAARIVADPDQVRRARESGRATVDLALPQPPRTVVVERPDLVLVTERANTLLRDIGLSESEADRIGGLTGSMVRAAEAEDMDDHERDDLANLNQA